MKRIFEIAVVLSLLAVASFAPLAVEAAGKPNIVYVLADDLGYGDLGCYGQNLLKEQGIAGKTMVMFTSENGVQSYASHDKEFGMLFREARTESEYWRVEW